MLTKPTRRYGCGRYFSGVELFVRNAQQFLNIVCTTSGQTEGHCDLNGLTVIIAFQRADAP